MNKSKKSLGVIDVLENGNIYIETGQQSNIVTRLGKNSKGEFQPYSTKIYKLPIFYCYYIKQDYIPATYETPEDFVTAFESQVETNSYIQNYIRLGAESMGAFLKRNHLLDSNVYFVSLKSDSNVVNQFLDYLIQNNDAKYVRSLLIVNEDVDVDKLSLSKLVKKEDVPKYKDLIATMKRPDRSYSFDKLKFSDDELYYFDGFVSINEKKLSEIKQGAEVIIVSDFMSSSALIHEAYRTLQKNGFNVFASVCLAKYK